MKVYTSLFLVLMVFGCAEKPSILLKNKETKALDNQPLVLNRTYFDLKPEDYLIFKDQSQNPIPAQFDDFDGDGLWDEVALELNFQPSEELSLNYEIVAQYQIPEFEIKTNAHLGVSPDRDKQFVSTQEVVRPDDHVAQSTPFLYQFEGPGWESDKVAFRAYFDNRNGKDIFGKKTSEMVLPKVGLGGNYHAMGDWGMDILKVGGSLGAGAIGILKNDSIYRLTNTEKASFKIIAQGAVRTLIEFKYEGWEVGDSSYDLIETISIWAGKRHYQSDLLLSGDGQDTLVTGIVNLKGLASKTLETPNVKLHYTHGKQSESGDYLGMGLIIPTKGLIAFGEAPKSGSGVTNTYTALLKPNNGLYQFAFYAGWELENDDFKSEASFAKALKEETTTFNNSIEIKK
ncbi:MAG: DUF4861 family protein [Cyclobacteriaceae bacterium]